MINMRNKLVWKDDTKRSMLKSTVLGYFTMWAVRQSPYLYPENLADGIEEFSIAIGMGDEYGGGFIETTCDGLEEIVSNAMDLCVTVQSWNVAKDGSNSPFVFVSRGYEPEPDHDIIDLGALARNIAHGVWLESCYDDGWFE